jgi:chemotaxis protein histidine kinase CheA
VSEATSSTISVMCSCGKKLKAPASAVGKKAKCPKCGNVLTVAPPPPPPDEDNSLDALYDLAQESEQHAAQQQLAPRCPGCMREMADGAVVCTSCGYDTRKGKAVAAAPVVEGTRFNPAAAAALEKSSKRGKQVEDKMAPQGPFWKGLVFSGVGALIGAVVWVGIAYATGYWGMLPVLLVALLAGLGMQRGQEGYSYLGGFTAAAITFVVMFVARFAVVMAIAIPMLHAEDAREQAEEQRTAEEEEAMRMPDFDAYDDRVVHSLYQAEVKAMKAKAPAAKPQPKPQNKAAEDAEGAEDEDDEPDEMGFKEKDRIAAYQAVEKKLKTMPESQYKAMVAKFEKDEEAGRLHNYVREDIIKSVIGTHPSRANSVEWDTADKAAKDKIAKMTQPQRDAEYKRLHAQHEKVTAARLEEEKRAAAAREAARTDDDRAAERATRNAAVAIGGIIIVLMVFGGIRGIILILLALGLAYRTASGSISD